MIGCVAAGGACECETADCVKRGGGTACPPPCLALASSRLLCAAACFSAMSARCASVSVVDMLPTSQRGGACSRGVGETPPRFSSGAPMGLRTWATWATCWP